MWWWLVPPPQLSPSLNQISIMTTIPMPIKTEKSEFGEDIVQFLLNSSMVKLTVEQQLQLKLKRPTPHLRFDQAERYQRRQLQHYDWYTRFAWIAGSITTNRLYCFTCLLFNANTTDEWTNTGVSHLAKHFEKKALRHQSSRMHLRSQEALQMLGKNTTEKSTVETCRLAAAIHNREAETRRSTLRQIVHELCRLGKQGLSIETCTDNCMSDGQDFSYLFWDEEGEPLRLDRIPVEQRRQLVQAIAAAMLGKMKEELAKSPFVSLQIDEAYESSPSRQVSVILRYCVGAKVVERFAGLYDLPEWGDLQLSVGSVVLKMIEEWELEGRLIGQSYDGSSMTPAGDCTIQAVVTDAGHHAPLVHSYMHRLDLILLYGTTTIREVRTLIGNLRLLRNFFEAPNRRTRLTNDGGIVPPTDATQWLSTVHEYFNSIANLLDSIVSNEHLWDPETLTLATLLRQRLDDYEFVYLLCFFHAIFANFIYPLVDFLDGSFSVYGSSTMEKIGKTIKDMRDLKKDVLVQSRVAMSLKLNPRLSFDEDMICHLRQLSEDIIVDMTRQLKTRFKDHHNLTALELLCELAFPNYAIEFPKLTFRRLVTYYPLFDQERLENELYNLYEDEQKRLPPAELLDYLVRNDLEEVYSEVAKLLRLSLSLPAVRPQEKSTTTTTTTSGECLLSRIKKAVANPHTSEYLAVLHVERELLDLLSNDKSFKERVIDLFAVMGDRPELIYHSVT